MNIIIDRLEKGYYYPKTSYKDDRNKYRKEQGELISQFGKDLAGYFGVTDNPKESLLFDKAWERGHEDGFLSVYEEYEDLVELII